MSKDSIYKFEVPDIDLSLALESIALISMDDYYDEHMVLQGFSYNLETKILTIYAKLGINPRESQGV